MSDNSLVIEGKWKYGCNIKKKRKKKIGTDYFTFVFSQSKSEPRLFHNYAKFSEFISLSSVCNKIYHFMKWKWFFWVYYSCEFWQICCHLLVLINVLHKFFFLFGWIECVVLWFNFILGLHFIFFCFKLVIIRYQYTITKENKIQTKDKLNHNKYTYTCFINHYTYTFPQVDSVALA